MANVKEFKERMSKDPRLDAFEANDSWKFRDEYLRAIAREAERQVAVDTKVRIQEREYQTVVGERAINLDDDFLVPVSIRWKEDTDDPKLEGWPVTIVSDRELL